jgi:D-alanine-D-alanine ligase-like ATP-grasp enzyme
MSARNVFAALDPSKYDVIPTGVGRAGEWILCEGAEAIPERVPKEAKYLADDGADLRVPADLPPAVSETVREVSRRAFQALGCEGMARVDFFVRDDFELVVNEANTIPGFTYISRYPRVLEASGVRYPELVDRLIRHAIARSATKPLS